MIHCFKLCGLNIVLDVASGSIHTVDNVAYDVVRLYEHDLSDKGQRELIGRVASLHPTVSESDILDIIYKIESLIEQGKLFSADVYEKLADNAGAAPLKALCLNVSQACNMSCKYCFAGCGERHGDRERQGDGSSVFPAGQGTGQGDGSSVSHPIFAEAESTKRQRDCPPETSHKTDEPSPCLPLMSVDTGKAAIDFLVKNSGSAKILDIDFFGGEPLLNWNVVKELVTYARESEKTHGKRFRFTLTTNGLLIDDDVITFTNRYFHNVVLSLDGRPEVHDAMRKLNGGGGTYDEVAPKIKKLVDARRAKGYYIRGTFTRENMDFVNDVLHLADLGYKELSLEPVVTKSDGLSFGFTLDDVDELCRQYDLLAVEMQRRIATGSDFSFYHYTLDLENGPCVHKRIAGCGVGTEYMAVTPDGELFPCHQFIGEPEFLLGDVWSGVQNERLRSEFAGASIYSRSECRDCWARFYCSGGCAANAYFDCGSIGGVHKLGCELFKKRIECAIMFSISKITTKGA